MKIITGFSSEQSISAAVNDIKAQFGNFDSKFVLYFASSCYHPETLSKTMSDSFPGVPVAGCTTAGEIVSGRVLTRSVTAMGFSDQVIDQVKIEVLTGISGKFDMPLVMASFSQYYQQSVKTMNYNKFVGIILIDGLRGAEERIMDEIGDYTNVFFVGGSAGDDLKFKAAYVFADGKAFTDAAVMILLKPKTKFGIIKTQSFRSLDKQLKVTKADHTRREVIEFNHQPAAEAYSQALGIEPEKANTCFMKNPVGLFIEGELFVRSPQQILSNGRMNFYCNILEGMELTVLDSTDIIADTKEALQQKQQQMGRLSGIIMFNCILRALDLEAKGRLEDYGNLFSDIPTIGFNTYGEEYLGHINQTATMLVFS